MGIQHRAAIEHHRQRRSIDEYSEISHPELYRTPSRCLSELSYNRNRTSNRNNRLNHSYVEDSTRKHKKRRSRRSYPFPSGSARRKEYLSPSKGIIDLDEKTRSFIRRIALSTLIAAVTVCVICAIAKWREVESERRKNAWIDKSEFWTDFFYNQFSCSGVGIASIIVGLIFV